MDGRSRQTGLDEFSKEKEKKKKKTNIHYDQVRMYLDIYLRRNEVRDTSTYAKTDGRGA